MLLSTIDEKYDSTAVTFREDFVPGSTVKQAYVAHLSSFSCHVQPNTPTLTEGYSGSYGKEWIMFAPVLDFKEGDKVVVNGTDVYKINGIETFNFGINDHCEVILRRFAE